MAEYRNGSHTVYDIKYHFVWITKYRFSDAEFHKLDLEPYKQEPEDGE